VELRDARIRYRIFIPGCGSPPQFSGPSTHLVLKPPPRPFLSCPFLIYWLLLDAALGMGIVGAAILLLTAAAMIVNSAEWLPVCGQS